MEDQIFIQHRFTIIEGDKSFSDALYYNLDDYDSIPKATIEAEKQARFDSWKVEIAKPKPPVDVDQALLDCQAQIDYYTAQKVSYQAQKASVGGGK